MQKLLLRLNLLLWTFRRSLFYRDMADAIRRKVGLRDFLEREANNAKMLHDSVRLSVMRALGRRYATGEGASLGELLSGIAPRSDQMLLTAVDDAGANKADALGRAADAVDFQIRGLKTLLKNLVMPAVAMPIVGALCVITSEIVVGIAKNSPPEVWKGFNGLVRWLAEWINVNAVSILVAIAVLVAITVYILPRWKGPARLKADKAVGFSLYRDYHAAVVLSALAMMISSGKTLRQALDDLRPTAPPWLRWQLQRVINSLEENPTDYMAAFSRGLMPPTVRARLASLLDSSKSFDEALITLGTSEVARLEANVTVSAQAVNYTLTGILVAVAVVLSIGQMTIASALSSASEPSKLLQRR